MATIKGMIFSGKWHGVIAIGLFVLGGCVQSQTETIHEYASQGNLEKVKELVAKGVSVQAKDEYGWQATNSLCE